MGPIVQNNDDNKKKSRKRKSDEADLENPPSKRRKLSTSKTNSHTNSSSKKSAKKDKNSKNSKKNQKLKGNDATERIKDFMFSQNRPHSKSSIANEIPNISKAQIEKSLEELKDDGLLSMKE